jgi:hypothetical protein
MVNSRLEIGCTQCFVRDRRPTLANGGEFLGRVGQPKPHASRSAHVQPGFRAQAGRRNLSRRQQQMRVKIALISRGPWIVDGQVNCHPVVISDFLRKRASHLQPAPGGQFCRKRDLDLAGDPGISSGLCTLRGIPQTGSISGPIHRLPTEISG